MSLTIRPMTIPVFREGEPVTSEVDQLWQVTWGWRGEKDQSIFSNWYKAVDHLDSLLNDGTAQPDDVVYAGEIGVPWTLTEYIVAARQAAAGERDSVFKTYSRSAQQLVHLVDLKHRLADPWVTADATTSA